MCIDSAKETILRTEPRFRLRIVWNWVKQEAITLKEFTSIIEYVNQLGREGR